MFQSGKKVEGTEGKYGPDYAANFICDFIGRNKENPFVVYYPMILVHNPFDPTPDSVDWNEKKSKREPLDRFGDMVTYMDKKIGQLVAKLEAEGLRENTLIMITGDNGTNKGIESPWPPRNGIIGGKGQMIDDGTHVAFVANWPGTIKPGTVVESPIDFSDVFPTITEVTGSPAPSDLDGQSMLPLLKGDESNARGWAYVDYSRRGKPPYRHFIRTKRYKLYSTGELYDIPNDWMEQNPLTSPETDGVRKRLQTAMDNIHKDHPTDDEIRKRQAEKGGVN
jgi:arylsulfatase A